MSQLLEHSRTPAAHHLQSEDSPILQQGTRHLPQLPPALPADRSTGRHAPPLRRSETPLPGPLLRCQVNDPARFLDETCEDDGVPAPDSSDFLMATCCLLSCLKSMRKSFCSLSPFQLTHVKYGPDRGLRLFHKNHSTWTQRGLPS